MASGIPLLPRFFEKRIETWADKRQPPTHTSAIIDRHHLYILPSKAGLVFFLVLLIIFIGAINYENNMAFLLCFLLVSISLLSMIYTHLNLNQIHIQTAPAASVFVGQIASFPLVISHHNPRDSIHIQLEADQNPPLIIHQLKAGEPLRVLLPVNTSRRGYQKLPKIKCYTEYPLGLFYAWSWVKLSAECLVYPAIAPIDYQSAQHAHQSASTSRQLSSGQDDFDHLRDYQTGDAPSHIAWKTYARSGELLTRCFQSARHPEHWIDWFNLPANMDTEEKLSILCKQIIKASQDDIPYGLKLPGQNIDCATGREHRHQCLRALALFSQ